MGATIFLIAFGFFTFGFLGVLAGDVAGLAFWLWQAAAIKPRHPCRTAAGVIALPVAFAVYVAQVFLSNFEFLPMDDDRPVMHESWLPLSQVVSASDGTRTELVPLWVNPVLMLCALVFVIVIVLNAYDTVRRIRHRAHGVSL